MRVTLDWLGVSTFRLLIDDLVILLDAYIDRVSAAPQVGITTKDVERADYILIGHAHFDHLSGAERIAARIGATVIGSYETVRLLHDSDSVPEAQLIAVAGGEPVQLFSEVRVRVFPCCTRAYGRQWRALLVRPASAIWVSRARSAGRGSRV
jgi:L-ascorbate metabolism protein UlaG (beta-lactamase superfamily)